MAEQMKVPDQASVERREFLACGAAAGGAVLLASAAGPARVLARGAARADAARRGAVRPGTARLEDFAGLVGQQFGLRREGGEVARVRLIEVALAPSRGAPRFRRQHFSIVLDVPREVALEQGQYAIRHPQLGSLQLFMVPVDLPARYHRLQAVFT